MAAWLRRWRGPLAIGLAVVLVALAGVLTRPTTRADFDPESPAPGGTRALVRILAARGVQVQVVRSVADVAPATDATLVVTDPGLVPYDSLGSFTAAGRLVLLEPDAVVLDELGLPVVPAGRVPAAAADPQCGQPDAVAAGRVLAGGTTYRLTPDAGPATRRCYPATEADPGGTLVVTAGTDGAGDMVVLGQPDLLRNRHLPEEGNAALALRLLGRHDRLQWYIPDPLELSGEEQPSAVQLLPPWVGWVALQLALAVGLVMLWRGRRLGALVREPLPVVVRSAETHEGRARLYRRARARDRAAAILRTATARRLAVRMQATGSDPADLAMRVAEQTGTEPAAARDLLAGPPPADDAGLVTLATRLHRLEGDLRTARSGHGDPPPEQGRHGWGGPGRENAAPGPGAAPGDRGTRATGE